MINGWPDDDPNARDGYDGTLKLQGQQALVMKCDEPLTAVLKKQGIEPGCWRLPVFIASELAQAGPNGEQTALPVFLSPLDVQTAYEKVGVPEEALEKLNMMEIRSLLKFMAEDPTEDAVNPWRAIQFFPTVEARDLALQLTSGEQ
mmetsp:Transcript_22615/g.57581  ORF Transcript_22615/g.57581 Transcript_22615/m.57581 type:complete len:146 (-) Transcript_22615:271-708(-)